MVARFDPRVRRGPTGPSPCRTDVPFEVDTDGVCIEERSRDGFDRITPRGGLCEPALLAGVHVGLDALPVDLFRLALHAVEPTPLGKPLRRLDRPVDKALRPTGKWARAARR